MRNAGLEEAQARIKMPAEISITSDVQVTPPLWQKVKRNYAGDLGSIPGSRRAPAEGNGNPLQHSCLGNPMDRGAWRAAVQGVPRVGHG